MWERERQATNIGKELTMPVIIMACEADKALIEFFLAEEAAHCLWQDSLVKAIVGQKKKPETHKANFLLAFLPRLLGS